jgi:hypothetical protein
VSVTYRVLMGVVVGLHVGFLTYVVAGGFLAWRWPRSIVPHAGVVAWGLAGLAVPVPCPLTDLENALRRRVGEPPLRSGFIDHYVQGVLYPASLTPLVRWLVAAAIVASWLGVYAHHRGRHPGSPDPAAGHRRQRNRTSAPTGR